MPYRYPPEFRRRVLDLLAVGRSVASLSADPGGGMASSSGRRMVGVSRQTAYRWVKRRREEGEAGLLDRSSRPRHSPNRVPAVVEEQIVEDRITEKEGPHLMAGRLGVPRSTIYRVLRRRGLSRLCDLDRTTAVPIRYVRD